MRYIYWIVGIVIVVTIGYFGFYYQNDNQPVSIPDGWKTYSSDALNISIAYPVEIINLIPLGATGEYNEPTQGTISVSDGWRGSSKSLLIDVSNWSEYSMERHSKPAQQDAREFMESELDKERADDFQGEVLYNIKENPNDPTDFVVLWLGQQAWPEELDQMIDTVIFF